MKAKPLGPAARGGQNKGGKESSIFGVLPERAAKRKTGPSKGKGGKLVGGKGFGFGKGLPGSGAQEESGRPGKKTKPQKGVMRESIPDGGGEGTQSVKEGATDGKKSREG